MTDKLRAAIEENKEFVISLTLISGYLLIQILANLTVSGSVDILRKMTRTKAQLQKVDVVSQAQEHGLRALSLRRSTRSLRRQLALDCREDTLDLCALTVALAWEAPSHLRPRAFDLPVSTPTLGRNNAVSSEHISNVPVVTFTIELSIGQDQADGRPLVRRADQWPQGRAVVVRPLSSILRQHVAPQDVDDNRPLRPMFPLQPFAAVSAPIDKERADRAWCQSGSVYGHDCLLAFATSTARREPPDDRDEDGVEHLIGHTAHEAVESRVVGYTLKPERAAQVRMFREPDFGFAEGSVLKPHQAQDGHQLRLREDMLGELATVGGQHDFERRLCKEH